MSKVFKLVTRGLFVLSVLFRYLWLDFEQIVLVLYYFFYILIERLFEFFFSIPFLEYWR